MTKNQENIVNIKSILHHQRQYYILSKSLTKNQLENKIIFMYLLTKVTIKGLVVNLFKYIFSMLTPMKYKTISISH